MSESAMLSQSQQWQASMAASGDSRGVRGRPQLSDYLYFIVLSLGVAYCLTAYTDFMDGYEKVILCGAVPLLVWMADCDENK